MNKNEKNIDIIEFAEKILGYKLYDYQKPILKALSEGHYVFMGMRNGKSMIRDILQKYSEFKS